MAAASLLMLTACTFPNSRVASCSSSMGLWYNHCDISRHEVIPCFALPCPLGPRGESCKGISTSCNRRHIYQHGRSAAQQPHRVASICLLLDERRSPRRNGLSGIVLLHQPDVHVCEELRLCLQDQTLPTRSSSRQRHDISDIRLE